jgi:hypothetical protein
VNSRNFFAGVTLALMTTAFVPEAFAHGDVVSRKGGVAVAAGEMTIEFVVAERRIAVYLNDHGDAVATKGAQGTLVVRAPGTQGRAIPMRVAADDGFEARDVAVEPGEELMFFAKMPDGQVHVAEFTPPRRAR